MKYEERFYEEYYEEYYEEGGFPEYQDQDVGESAIFEFDGICEDTISEMLYDATLIPSKETDYKGPMSELIFIHGDPEEIYTNSEISFIESVSKVYVYHEFYKAFNNTSMPCRTVVIEVECEDYDLLHYCIASEKIINKALYGFNIFLFISDDILLMGCRIFNGESNKNCLISQPFVTKNTVDSIINDLCCIDQDEFIAYYSQIVDLINTIKDDTELFENHVPGGNGVKFSMLKDNDKLKDGISISLSKEERLYYDYFQNGVGLRYCKYIEDIEDNLSFIKSRHIDMYEMIYEANTRRKNITQFEEKNAEMSNSMPLSLNSTTAEDNEAKQLLDDPEKMIKLLKKRRGI